MKGTVSVIIPMYNAERYIRDCLDSLTRQSYTNFEVIIIDDGSLDDSYNIALSYASIDSRFYVVQQNNSGPAVARNLGLTLHKGEYVFFLDADDFLTDDALHLCIDKIQTDNTDIIYGDCYSYSNGKLIDKKERFKHGKYSSDEMIYKLLTHDCINSVWGKLYRSNLLTDIKFNDNLTIGEDMLFNLYVLCNKSVTVGFINEKVYVYRIVSSSITHKRHQYNELSEKVHNYINALEKFAKFHLPKELFGYAIAKDIVFNIMGAIYTQGFLKRITEMDLTKLRQYAVKMKNEKSEFKIAYDVTKLPRLITPVYLTISTMHIVLKNIIQKAINIIK